MAALAAPAVAMGATPVYEVSARCDGKARCFPSIGQAIAASEQVGGGWVDIRVGPGDYREKLTIRRAKTRLTGSGVAKTRLHFDAVAQRARAWHRDGWGTPGSATLTIRADRVTVSGLTVENRFDYLANDARPQGDPARIADAQAVALLLDVGSDRVLLRHVALLGYQDTLFANGRRALIRDSLIAGNIDFIFGKGMLWIDRSELRSRPRAQPPAPGGFQSYIAAPSTPRSQAMGIVFARSRLTREAGVPDGAVALARPWHPTTRFADGRYADPDAVGQAVFIDCFMDAHIHPDHWTGMAGTARDGSKSAFFRPQDARFFERGSHGPGAPHRDIGMRWTSPQSLDRMWKQFATYWPDIGK
ncbi:pectinesterase family protein [Sphingobium sp. JS3065]|uniref:pectinesterase family protein n=1 Tax=Sphingobium sp. JS3065 TaxID=2970925 RepID=UPI0022652953|nr:pectinesterase family protein [Sphingobium sp. JS3065]UZW57744.1 pectinesterase family protein [Sphingobium sp. JS3065]